MRQREKRRQFPWEGDGAPAIHVVILGGILRAAGGVLSHVVGFGIGVGAGFVVGSIVLGRKRNFEVASYETVPCIAELEEEAILQGRPDEVSDRLMRLIPEWVKCPDFDHAAWINAIVLRAWPFAGQAAQTVFTDRIWPGVKEKLPKFLQVTFQVVSLGDLPPSFDGIKAIDTIDDEVMVETSLRLASNCNIVADIVIGGCLRTTVQITELFVDARVRVVLRPLTAKFPCFAAMEFSVLDKPNVDAGVKLLGGHDVMSIPFVRLMFDHALSRALSRVMLWPQRIRIPLQPEMLSDASSGGGTLVVRIIQGKGLVCQTIIGQAQPYVKLWVDERSPKRTKVKLNTLHPVWNETVTLVCRDPAKDCLSLYAMDYQYTVQDRVMGFNYFSLEGLEPNILQVLEVELNPPTNAQSTKSSYGSLEIEVTFRPFRNTTAPMDTATDTETEEMGGAITDMNGQVKMPSFRHELGLPGSGMLTVIIHKAFDLEPVGGGSVSNAYCKIYLFNDIKRTRVVNKSCSPEWDEELEFLLESPPLDVKLRIEVWHKNLDTFRLSSGKKPLGELEIDLGDVVRNSRLLDIYQLNEVQTGRLKVEMLWQQ